MIDRFLFVGFLMQRRINLLIAWLDITKFATLNAIAFYILLSNMFTSLHRLASRGDG